MNIEIGSKIPI